MMPKTSNGRSPDARLAAELLVNAYSLSRAMLWRNLNDPRRSIDDDCGYPFEEITIEQYTDMYEREPIPARVVDVLPEESWRSSPAVYEDEDASTVTAFEEAWDQLARDLRGSKYLGDEGHPLWEVLSRADRLSGIGAYGVILLGLDDGKPLSEAVEGIDPKTGEASTGGGGGKPRKLLYLRAMDQSMVQVSRREQDQTSRRYGSPTEYTINVGGSQSATIGDAPVNIQSQQVHWTRVIHVADNLKNSETDGIPRMRPVWKRLLDLQKLYGGSAEMYWQGAFPGRSWETHPQLGGDVTVDRAGMRDEIEKMINSLQRDVITTGMTAKMLSPTVVDPTPQINVQIDAICIQIGVPRTIFIGSEPGRLGGEGGFNKGWNQRLRDRQTKYITPRIIVPTIDRLILVRVLPPVEEYHVEWPELDVLGAQEKATVAVTRTDALVKYVAGQVETLVPPRYFFTRELGYTDEEADEILEAAAEVIEEKQEEQEAAMEQQQILAEKQAEAAAKTGRTSQQGKEQEVDKPKPPFAENVFCATGPGGGKDPSCSKEGGDGGKPMNYKEFRASGRSEDEWEKYREEQNKLSRERTHSDTLQKWSNGERLAGIDAANTLLAEGSRLVDDKLWQTLQHEDTVVSKTSVDGRMNRSEGKKLHGALSDAMNKLVTPGGPPAVHAMSSTGDVANAGDDDCEWITMGGQAVCIKGGQIVKGSDELKKLVNKPSRGGEKKTPVPQAVKAPLKVAEKEPKQTTKTEAPGRARMEHDASVTEDQVSRAFSGESKTMAIMAARTIEAGTGKGIVAKDGGKIVGITSYKTQGKDIYVRYLSSAQKGVGTRLVGELAKVASESGKGLVLEGFVGARGFYEKIGMKALGKPGPSGNVAYGWSRREAQDFAGRTSKASKEGG
jgi:hypothetical protein